jgi:transcription factor SPN1
MEFIDTAVLKESQLGRVVLFYTKCKRVTPDIARIANHLVSTWSRPIIKRSASYRDRVVPIAAITEDGQPKEHLNTILAKLKDEEKGRVRKHTVQVPHAVMGDYTFAPRATAGISRPNVSVDLDIERRKKNNEMLRSFTRRVANK